MKPNPAARRIPGVGIYAESVLENRMATTKEEEEEERMKTMVPIILRRISPLNCPNNASTSLFCDSYDDAKGEAAAAEQ